MWFYYSSVLNTNLAFFVNVSKKVKRGFSFDRKNVGGMVVKTSSIFPLSTARVFLVFIGERIFLRRWVCYMLDFLIYLVRKVAEKNLHFYQCIKNSSELIIKRIIKNTSAVLEVDFSECIFQKKGVPRL